ncbi:FtsW/RodA/SpoVE family cell cycle protein [uncultured Muribaculum sp.]|uniref:FtsW/RodA/SpoVE family cell cycle protein n=1 Tax=uncultured Muribaculum sp. TaxID=1918613 RepID=UPI0025CB9E86|nr:FtsW/RodA/SpoVE family cell cycle protein [uncultured Muribaculum sp.]
MTLDSNPTSASPFGNIAAAATKAIPSAPAATFRRHGDKYIWGVYIALCLVSIIELYSASSREVASAGVYGPIVRHLSMLLAGFGIVWTLERMHYKWFYALAYVFVGFSVLLMVYITFFGDVINGARRSVTLGPLALQGAEFIKLSAVLAIAKIMGTSQKAKSIGVETRAVVISGIVIAIFCGLLLPQGLTNTILLTGIAGAMILIGGTEWKKVLMLAGVFALLMGCVGVYKLLGSSSDEKSAELTEAVVNTGGTESVAGARQGTWKKRLDRFFGDSIPKYEMEITAENRQEMLSYIAQANGGLIGVFPGNSRETARLPLAFSDYIYAIILEDVGFIGGTALLVLYLILLARAGMIAQRCHRAFPVILLMGLAVMIVLQALFHMAITTGTFPVSGQPLPLISKGGTSILITSIAFGMMLSVSRTAVQKGTTQQIKEELNALPEELRADNPVELK